MQTTNKEEDRKVRDNPQKLWDKDLWTVTVVTHQVMTGLHGLIKGLSHSGLQTRWQHRLVGVCRR